MSATDSTSTYSAKRRILYGVTTGGLLLGGLGMATAAQADAGASGTAADSPGLASGNQIGVPIDLPVNLCGDTVNVVGLLDSAAGNSCSNGGGPGSDSGSATATGSAVGSPGLASGNLINVPVNAPINACGDSVNVIGLGNSALGNACANESGSGSSATASGSAVGSPGLGSGNLINVPVNAPINACGDSVNVIGLGNSAYGNACANGGPSNATPPCPPPVSPPCPPPVSPPCPPIVTPPPVVTTPPTSVIPPGNLASTGSGALAAVPLAFGLLGMGYLTRRSALKSAMR